MAYELAAERLTRPQIAEELVRRGASPQEAAVLADTVAPRTRERAGRAGGKNDALIGTLWVVGGVCVSFFSYVSAGPGKTFVLAWGAIVYGLIKVARAPSR